MIVKDDRAVKCKRKVMTRRQMIYMMIFNTCKLTQNTKRTDRRQLKTAKLVPGLLKQTGDSRGHSEVVGLMQLSGEQMKQCE